MRELASSPRGRWYLLALFVVALLFTAARFPGIEGHSAYHGMVFKILHPDSFPGDTYVSSDQPMMLSAYTLLVKAAGESALDDRFQMMVYLVLTIAALIAVDRLLNLFGVPPGIARLTVIGLMLFEHRLVDNIPHIVDATSAFRPSSYAQPIGMWLLYLLLSGAHVWAVALLLLFLGTMSVKNAWFPALASLAIVARDRLSLKPKHLVLAAAGLVVVVVAAIAAFNMFRGVDLAQQARLFEMSARYENSEANPFLDGVGWIIFLGILVVAAALPYPRFADRAAVGRARTLLWVTAGAYVCAGLYYTFAPDILKLPVLIALAANRSSWWAQNLVQLLFGAYAVLAIADTSGRRRWGWIVALGAMLAFPLVEYTTLRHVGAGWRLDWSTQHLARLALFVAALSVLGLLVRVFRASERRGRDLTATIVMLALLSSVAVSFTYKIVSRGPALAMLMRHGVMGDNQTATWIGVNEWVLANTRADETILALSGTPPRVDTSLRTRTGRTEFIGNEASVYFDYPARIAHEERASVVRWLEERWAAGDSVGVSKALAWLGMPDLLIFPADQAIDLSQLGYAKVAQVRGFSIARAQSP